MEYHVDAKSVTKYQLHLIKKELQNLCLKLGYHGEECLLITVNLSDKSSSYLGSSNGVKFLQTKIFGVVQQFYSFCNQQMKTTEQPICNTPCEWTNIGSMGIKRQRVDRLHPLKSRSRSDASNSKSSHSNQSDDVINKCSSSLTNNICLEKILANTQLQTKRHTHYRSNFDGVLQQLLSNDPRPIIDSCMSHSDSENSENGPVPVIKSCMSLSNSKNGQDRVIESCMSLDNSEYLENSPVSVRPSSKYKYLNDTPIARTQKENKIISDTNYQRIIKDINGYTKEAANIKGDNLEIKGDNWEFCIENSDGETVDVMGHNSGSFIETRSDRGVKEMAVCGDNWIDTADVSHTYQKNSVITNEVSIGESGSAFTICMLDDNLENVPAPHEKFQVGTASSITAELPKKVQNSYKISFNLKDDLTIISEDDFDLSCQSRNSSLRDINKPSWTDEKMKNNHVDQFEVCVDEAHDDFGVKVLELKTNQCSNGIRGLAAAENENKTYDNHENKKLRVVNQEGEMEAYAIVETESYMYTEQKMETKMDEEKDKTICHSVDMEEESDTGLIIKRESESQLDMELESDSRLNINNEPEAESSKGIEDVADSENNSQLNLSRGFINRNHHLQSESSLGLYDGEIKGGNSVVEMKEDNSVDISENKDSYTKNSKIKLEMFISYTSDYSENEDNGQGVDLQEENSEKSSCSTRGGNSIKAVSSTREGNPRKVNYFKNKTETKKVCSNNKNNLKNQTHQTKNLKYITNKTKKYRKKKSQLTRKKKSKRKTFSFFDKTALNEKIVSDNLFKCEFCLKCFQSQNSLDTHKRFHDKKLENPCSECDSVFKSALSLKKHRKLEHDKVDKFICEICGVQLTTKHNLEAHYRLHTGERPHQCKVCLKRFKTKCACDQHLRVHSDEKRYTCELCGKMYKFSHKFKIHKEIIHKGLTPFSCEVCGKAFNRKDNLKVHIRSHGKKQKQSD